MFLFTKKEIIIPGQYIIKNIENGTKKEQIATIVNKYDSGIYEFTYGKLNNNIGFCTINNIRNITWYESKIKKRIPSDFYPIIIEIF